MISTLFVRYLHGGNLDFFIIMLVRRKKWIVNCGSKSAAWSANHKNCTVKDFSELRYTKINNHSLKRFLKYFLKNRGMNKIISMQDWRIILNQHFMRVNCIYKRIFWFLGLLKTRMVSQSKIFFRKWRRSFLNRVRRIEFFWERVNREYTIHKNPSSPARYTTEREIRRKEFATWNTCTHPLKSMRYNVISFVGIHTRHNTCQKEDLSCPSIIGTPFMTSRYNY